MNNYIKQINQIQKEFDDTFKLYISSTNFNPSLRFINEYYVENYDGLGIA